MALFLRIMSLVFVKFLLFGETEMAAYFVDCLVASKVLMQGKLIAVAYTLRTY